MDFSKGYRLRVSTLSDFASFTAAYRTTARKTLGAAYAQQVARTAVGTLDAAVLGIAPSEKDIFEVALESVRSAHDKVVDGIYAKSLNCVIGFHFVGNAVLAVMSHGAERHRRAFESSKQVVQWGWSPSSIRPSGISEKAWADRARYWAAVGKASNGRFGELRLELLNGQLPSLGWSSIEKAIPPLEWRIEQCVRRLALAEKRDPGALSQRDRDRFAERARQAIPEKVGRETFRLSSRRASVPAAAREGPVEKPSGPQPEPSDGRAAFIDHADIVVASDGRPFMAVPYVGLKAEDRLFVQIGSRDVTFLQNGIIYGTVTSVPISAREYLRSLTSITVVEVSTGADGKKKLLRAKHATMVSDISLMEGLRRPVQTFRRTARGAGIEEM